MRPAIAAGLFILAITAAAHADEATKSSASWAEEFDQLWPRRDQKERDKNGKEKPVIDRLYKLVEDQLKKESGDFEANWRLASVLNWDANSYPNGELKAGLGKRAWTVSDRAIQARPDDVRGQYNAAVGIGLYSEGVGILTALSQGLEGKFKSRIQAALRIDKAYLQGAPQVVWGRYFFKLPWPKRDVDESIKVLQKAVGEHPANLRAKLYLAESLQSDGKKQEMRKLIDEIAGAPLGADGPEDRKVKAEAAAFAQEHKGDF